MLLKLPEFEDPPVVEVAISLQFKVLEALRTPHFGLLWKFLRTDGYTRLEEHGELEPATEQFERVLVPRVGIRVQTFDDAPPSPRIWFLNEPQNELIQVQRDRLIVNWRRGAHSEEYPRYTHIIKRFWSALDLFGQFARAEQLGDITPTQCEVTYVNHIPSDAGWSVHGDLEHVVTTWENRYSDDYLGMPEDVGFQARYRMNDHDGKALGRLHVIVQPGFQTVGSKPIFVVNLTARGKPDTPARQDVSRLFDSEHEWIVRGFTSITTKRMHEIWRRKNG